MQRVHDWGGDLKAVGLTLWTFPTAKLHLAQGASSVLSAQCHSVSTILALGLTVCSAAKSRSHATSSLETEVREPCLE